MTTTTKIAGEAMTNEQIIEIAAQHVTPDGWMHGELIMSFARALLASKDAVPQRTGVEHFNYLCSLLPEGFHWSDPLTPDVLNHIVSATAPAQSCGDAEQIEQYVLSVLPSVYYMDPPDGGSVSVLEQLRRMADDATKYRAALTAEKVAAEPAAYDMTYTNGNRGLVYPKELAHIEKARIVTGYVAAPLYAAAQPAQTQVALTVAQRVAIEAAISISADIEADSHDGSFLSAESVEALRTLLAAQPVSGGNSADQA